jgi:hypothetical protein
VLDLLAAVDEVVHPDDLARTAEAWRRAVETGGQYEIEHRIRRADGTFHWLFLSRGVPVRDERGRIAKWYGTATDIPSRCKRSTPSSLRGVQLREPLVRGAQLPVHLLELVPTDLLLAEDASVLDLLGPGGALHVALPEWAAPAELEPQRRCWS